MPQYAGLTPNIYCQWRQGTEGAAIKMTSSRLWALVLGFMALHLALAMYLPLVEDEAYYQMWARVPSAGYYDHPPMVAWGIAAGEALLGRTLIGVRLASVLFAGLITLLTYRIAFLFGRDQKIAFRAALWGAVMLPFAAFGFAATPDPASVFFWTAATWALAEVLSGGRANWWLLVGLFAGLGVLSKFTNLFFGVGLVLWLVASPEGRIWARRWQVWLGALTGIAVLGPFLGWNMAHDWVGLERQFGRVGADNGFSALRFGAYWLTFAMLVTPVLFWLTARAIVSKQAPQVLLWLVAPLILYLAYHALNSATGGQWLVPVFPSLAVIAALGPAHTRLARWVTPSALALAAGILVLGFWPGRVIIAGNNPFTQGRGWAPVTADIRAAMQQGGATWIATDAYGLTGQINHYLGQTLPVWSVTQPKRYLFRPTFPKALCSAKALFISRTAFPAGVPYFAKTTRLPDLIRHAGDRVLMRYYVALVSGRKTFGGNACDAP